MTDSVRDNPALNRFELDVDGHTAFAAYAATADTVTFVSTRVPNELSGRGVGSTLAKGALAAVRAQGKRVVARCPFIVGYIEKHPEFHDLIAKE